MFDQDLDQPKEADPKRLYIIALVLIVSIGSVGLLLYRSAHQPPPPPAVIGLPMANRAGNSEYDEYAKNIAITNQEAYYTKNTLGGEQIIAIGRIQNLGQKAIKGIEIKLVAYGMDGKSLAEKLVAPIPNMDPGPLQANGTLPVTVNMISAPNEDKVREIKLELTGLILQQ